MTWNSRLGDLEYPYCLPTSHIFLTSTTRWRLIRPRISKKFHPQKKSKILNLLTINPDTRITTPVFKNSWVHSPGRWRHGAQIISIGSLENPMPRCTLHYSIAWPLSNWKSACSLRIWDLATPTVCTFVCWEWRRRGTASRSRTPTIATPGLSTPEGLPQGGLLQV